MNSDIKHFHDLINKYDKSLAKDFEIYVRFNNEGIDDERYNQKLCKKLFKLFLLLLKKEDRKYFLNLKKRIDIEKYILLLNSGWYVDNRCCLPINYSIVNQYCPSYIYHTNNKYGLTSTLNDNLSEEKKYFLSQYKNDLKYLNELYDQRLEFVNDITPHLKNENQLELANYIIEFLGFNKKEFVKENDKQFVKKNQLY